MQFSPTFGTNGFMATNGYGTNGYGFYFPPIL